MQWSKGEDCNKLLTPPTVGVTLPINKVGRGSGNSRYSELKISLIKGKKVAGSVAHCLVISLVFCSDKGLKLLVELLSPNVQV